MTLMLQTLRGNETLNASALVVFLLRLLAFFRLGLDLAADDVFADLFLNPVSPNSNSLASREAGQNRTTHIIILR